MDVKRTERGWAGHFCAAEYCLFRRNTLLEYGDKRIVVSTVGMMVDVLAKREEKRSFTTIGVDRHFETMAFEAHWAADRYWDADVTKEIAFDSPWAIAEVDADDRANDMHEAVVAELTTKLLENAI